MAKRVGKLDLQIRDVVEARTKHQVKQSIIEWINLRASNSILPNQIVLDSDEISKHIVLYQYKSIEFLLAYLDEIYHNNFYEHVVGSNISYLYRSITFTQIIDSYTVQIMKAYDEN